MIIEPTQKPAQNALTLTVYSLPFDLTAERIFYLMHQHDQDFS